MSHRGYTQATYCVPWIEEKCSRDLNSTIETQNRGGKYSVTYSLRLCNTAKIRTFALLGLNV